MPKKKFFSLNRPRSSTNSAQNAIYQLTNRYSSSLLSLGGEVTDMVVGMEVNKVAKEVPDMVIVREVI